MLIDITPLKKHRDFRLLYIGQAVSFLGSMITFVAVPYQIYELTKSSMMVGMFSGVQLVPLLLSALFGGVYADRLDRRKLVLVSEALMALCSLAFAINAFQPNPSITLIFIVTALASAVAGFHRPALEAMTQKLISKDEFASVSALNSLRFSLGTIGGPALAGILIARLGLVSTYFIDFASFGVSLIALAMMRSMGRPTTEKTQSVFADLSEGLRYARSRQELIGTYVVDMVAMTFAMPMALFPAMADRWGGAGTLGLLFSAMSIGSLITSLFSGWTSRVRRYGAGVVIAAALWGVAICALAFAPNLATAVVCLILAGAADMVSAVFRNTMWNQTIPSELRGRLASVEMMSYMSGPLLGNARAGWMGSITSPAISILSGGILCVLGVTACIPLLPKFWRYKSTDSDL